MTIKGTIENIRFTNPDGGWTAACIRCTGPVTGKDTRLNVTGVLPGIRIGMSLRAEGEIEDSKYGPTFRIATWHEELPTDVKGIENYLSSRFIKNIGPTYAKAIVSAFGEKTMDVLRKEPERLTEIHGIGKKRIASIVKSLQENKGIDEIMIWLKRYNITDGLATKIYQQYQGNAVAILEENPYRLADDIGGVGFKKADQVAGLLDIQPTSPFRLRSGVLAVLKDAASEGHTCLPVHTLQEKASGEDYLNVAPAYISEILSDPLFVDNEVVLNDEDEAALPTYHYAEKGIAKNIRRLLRKKPTLFEKEPDIPALEKETGITYSDEQRTAIWDALNEGFLIITGGPGTGKTATTNAIIRELEKQDLHVRLAAPTGRAAKRMNEVTGHTATTIHRLLEYSQGSFTRDEMMPLDGDAFIIDEASMIDTLLMNSLLKAIPTDGKVILVGDVDQLPSVGAGCVLRDLIDTGTIPTVRLTKIYRQAAKSKIITNAHLVNMGRPPILDSLPGSDFHFLYCETREEIRDYILDLVTRQIPKNDGIPTRDIQVLCAMRREWDPIATTSLNRELQAAINPEGAVAATRGGTQFRVGDRVMQVKNNYDKDIFNGDIGTITEILPPDRQDKCILRATFNENDVDLTQKDIADLELAYACTIHKSQGSEYPAVIIPVHDSQFIMLKKNLLYTGITRAKRLCILIGTTKAVMTAVHKEDTARRYTNLKEKIKTAKP